MASGWKLWVWLECIGVVSGCCCKEVYTLADPGGWHRGHVSQDLFSPALSLALLRMRARRSARAAACMCMCG